MICIRIIADIESKRFICSHHWKWFIMNIAGYTPFCHLGDDIICLLSGASQQTDQV